MAFEVDKFHVGKLAWFCLFTSKGILSKFYQIKANLEKTNKRNIKKGYFKNMRAAWKGNA